MKFKFISHRGNLAGRIPEFENRPDYIDKALDLGFDVEVDLWSYENKFFLGHDEGKHSVALHWLIKREKRLWIHVKNEEALIQMMKTDLHYFCHESDLATLTSRGFVWVYPGRQPIPGSIAVLPEVHQDPIDSCHGICSDLIAEYKLKKNKDI